MSAACELGLALMQACVMLPPSGEPPVTVNRSCVYRFTAAERDAAKLCAAENGIAWRINWRR